MGKKNIWTEVVLLVYNLINSVSLGARISTFWSYKMDRDDDMESILMDLEKDSTFSGTRSPYT